MEHDSTERRIIIEDGNVIDYSVLALDEFAHDRHTPRRERRRFKRTLEAVGRLSVAHMQAPEMLLDLNQTDAQVCLLVLRRYLNEHRLPVSLQDPERSARIARSAEHLDALLAA